LIYAERRGDNIEVKASPRDNAMMRSVPGALYRNGVWVYPLGWGSALALRSTIGAELELGPELTAWGYDRINEHALSRTVDDLWVDSRLRGKQVEGVHFLLKAKHVIMADEMRVGKTVQVAQALLLGDTLPALIIAPNSMKFKWADELADWAPGLTVQVVAGTAAKREQQIMSGADVVVVNWDILRLHSRLAPYGSTELSEKEKQEGALNAVQWRTVVADEAHRALTPKAKQTRALWYLMHRAEYRWALTGTPVRESPEDVWTLGHAIAPYDFPRRSAFIDRYTRSGNNGFGFEVFGWNVAMKQEALNILDPHFIRRTFAEVMPGAPTWLPPDHRRLEMTPKQAKAYKDMKKHMLTMLESGVLMTGDPMVQFSRLQQIASAMPVLDAEGNVVELDLPSNKIDAMLDIIEEGADDGLVVVSWSRKLIELAGRALDKRKITWGSVTGGVPAAERQLNVDRFQAAESQVMLLTAQAGGEGLTLNRSNRVLFLNRGGSLPQNLQVEARIGGIQQTRPMQAIDLLSEGTVDFAALETVFEKEGTLQEVVRDPNWMRRVLAT
jgi:SNF2 family DNA or RNA helicase